MDAARAWGERPRWRFSRSSGTGVARRPRPAPDGGFSMLEILLALAVVGLVAAILIGGTAQSLNRKPVSADDVHN